MAHLKCEKTAKRVGIVGYGHLGKFLVNEILVNGEKYGIELAFVWNRGKDVFDQFEHKSLILDNLCDFAEFKPNLIVEVAHPEITKKYGPQFIEYCDYMIGSPSALADEELEAMLRHSSTVNGLFIPKGALWGSQDIRSLSRRGQLHALHIEMHFHPHSLRLNEPLYSLNAAVTNTAVTLFEGNFYRNKLFCFYILGPVRNVCKLAPNNVNTMACAAIAAENLGFDRVIGTLVSDPTLVNYHKIRLQVLGMKREDGTQFKVTTERQSPAFPGCVTSSATYNSFFESAIWLIKQRKRTFTLKLKTHKPKVACLQEK
ncbi:putative L-aspartate dehydrogenase-like isoform X2 [Leptotrombidium deliense]|uniref:Aspartate dehydrogenase domain-containing protein n=1 Tax=Leptotrombidium deliense TaxID=299467 RepID=A0A443SFV8_9ACAR|nr:putative L-aspartate dehydrogenase-like isoform X2 [Leptotrombidium deliense]